MLLSLQYLTLSTTPHPTLAVIRPLEVQAGGGGNPRKWETMSYAQFLAHSKKGGSFLCSAIS